MSVVRFGVFELDTDAAELRRQGRLIHLTGQPLAALQVLVSRPGAIVTREELRRRIWEDGRFVDFDRSLNFCIAAVRSALGDSARNPRFIETLPRRGYRFIAEVSVRPRPAVESRGSTLRRVWWTAVIPLMFLQGAPATRAHTRTTTNPDALMAFERGLAETTDGGEGLRRSIYQFREATRFDPRFAEAHYALASAYLSIAARRELPARAPLAEARAEALRALALEDVPETRRLLGLVRLLHDRDWNGARADLARAVRAQPDSDGLLATYARYLSAAGDDVAAIAAIDRAETISPSCDLVLWESALIRYRAHRPDEALEKARLAETFGPPEDMDADRWSAKIAWLRLLIHAQQQAWTEAAEDARATETGDFAGAGSRPAILGFLRASAERAARERGPALEPTWVATLYAAAGDDKAALDWLERAVGANDVDAVFDLRNPAFDRLRSADHAGRLFRRAPGAVSY